MAKPLLLDLFCCAGGAARGYDLAGFDVIGVDISPQPRFPYEFVQGDAISVGERLIASAKVNAIHASPPCQAHSDLQKQSKIEYDDFIPQTRALCEASGLPYVIENVEGSPLLDPTVLCGTMFPGLRVIRHRLFETNFDLPQPDHPDHPLVYTRDKRKNHYGRLDEMKDFVMVNGGGNCSVKAARDAMGIDWMTKKELNQSLPPVYTEYIGQHLMVNL